jgi:hypothetical protein
MKFLAPVATVPCAALAALALTASSPVGALSPPPPIPTSALVEFYQATGGDDWTRNDGWLDADVHPCDWYGVICNSDFGSPVLSGLNLPDNNLSSSIAGLELFEHLTELVDLSGNELSGELDRIPAWIRSVNLSRNQFEGSLPEVRAGVIVSTPPPDMFHGVQNLNLAGNQFSGRVPEDWNRMALSVLDLSNNLLDTGIENAFAAIGEGSGGELYLHDNRFSGSLSPQVTTTTLWETDLPLSGGGLNLCWNDLDIDDPDLIDYIDRHHVAGPGWQDCLNRERTAIDPTISGSWFSPQRSGEGFSLMLLESGQPLIYSFSYTPEGEQLWYFEIGRSGEKFLDWPNLLETRGDFSEGLRFVDDTPALRNIARLRIDRLGSGTIHLERAVIDYSGCPPFDGLPPEEGDPIPLPCPISPISDRSFQIQLSRLAGTRCDHQTDQQWISGAWYNPERVGEGFVVEAIEDGRGVVYWFTYTADGSGQQVWLIGDAFFDGTILSVDSMLQPTGARSGRDFDNTALELQDWGGLVLEFLSPDRASVRFSSRRDGFGSGEFEIDRLARPMLPDCRS